MKYHMLVKLTNNFIYYLYNLFIVSVRQIYRVIRYQVIHAVTLHFCVRYDCIKGIKQSFQFV